jgi:hypothetical protein
MILLAQVSDIDPAARGIGSPADFGSAPGMSVGLKKSARVSRASNNKQPTVGGWYECPPFRRAAERDAYFRESLSYETLSRWRGKKQFDSSGSFGAHFHAAGIST